MTICCIDPSIEVMLRITSMEVSKFFWWSLDVRSTENVLKHRVLTPNMVFINEKGDILPKLDQQLVFEPAFSENF